MRDMLALRLDDVGASSKKYEVYSNRVWKLSLCGRTLKIGGRKLKFQVGNWFFFKSLPAFKAWGPYREMTAQEWHDIYALLEQFDAKLTVAVTAAWAESEHQLVPFPERFPEEAHVLKEGFQRGLLEIANHGLSHCVLTDNLFKPKRFSGNRQYHREFWDWIPRDIHEKHIRESQDILQTYFQTEIVTFVPPGNVFAEMTLEIAEKYGIRYVSCQTSQRRYKQVMVIGNEQIIPFHDREIVLYGVKWLKPVLQKQHERFCFVKELGERFLERKDDITPNRKRNT